ncbi:MAG TPA: TonB-dependent receptor plug domain-containing protein [Rudaea sp.]
MKTRTIAPTALAAAIALCLSASAFAQDAATNKDKPQTLQQVDVKERRSQDDTRPKLQHIMREVDGPLITVTKKTSITKLDNIPTVVDNNLRDLFAQTPGLYLSEQQTASQFNLSYRGIGNPQESEFVSVLQDGIPLEGDWIGFPTLYVLPMPQTISEVQLIRGGSSLLYGPEPGPVVNFVSRKPDPNRQFGGYTENIWGNNGLFGTFNSISGTVGEWDYLLDAHYRTDEGQRDNAGAILKGADFHVGYHASEASYWAFDFHGYEFTGGDPGKYGYPIFVRDQDFTPTPYNKDWVNRYVGVLSNKTQLSSNIEWDTKLWRGYQDQTTRAAGALLDVPKPAYPALTTLQDATFRFTGIDSRIVDRWGRGNALTAGFVYYSSDAPLRQWNDSNLWADRYDRFDPVCANTNAAKNCVRLNQDRSTDYGALFAENVFRWGEWHFVPSVRLERETVDIDESVHVRNAPANTIPLADRSVDHTVPLFGLGFGNDFGHGNETYFNVSQGWRPVRYFDVASPFGNLAPTAANDPTPTHVLSYEAGVHGTPVAGLFYDASLFWVNVKDRIEAQPIPGDPLNETIDVNTGNTRHRGFEGQIDYDFLAARDPHTTRHFSVFLNLQLLNAEFTSSRTPALIGSKPAFSPKYLARAGLVYREDKKMKLALSVNSVASQYWGDANTAFSTPASDTFIPAKLPQYTLVDFSGDYYVLPQLRLLAGVSNIGDKKYFNRVFSNGIEPGSRRTYYGGFSYEF